MSLPKKPTGGDKGQAKKPDEGGGRDKNDAVALQEQAVRYADSLFSDDEAKTGLTGGIAYDATDLPRADESCVGIKGILCE